MNSIKFGHKEKLAVKRYRIILAILVAGVTAVSGCTGASPAEEAKIQAEEARKEMMQQLEKQQVDIEVMAVYERDGDTVFSLRNTGRKAFTTGNISVATEEAELECKPLRQVSPGSSADCTTDMRFPSVNNTVKFKVFHSGTRITGYNCTIRSEPAVAC